MALLTQRRRAEDRPVKTIYVTSLDEMCATLKSPEAIQAGYVVRSYHNTKFEMSLHFNHKRDTYDMHREAYRWWEIDIFRDPIRADWPLNNDGEEFTSERFGNN